MTDQSPTRQRANALTPPDAANAANAPTPRLDETDAQRLAEAAVDEAGGSLMIYRNPRHPFSLTPTQTFEIDGHAVEIRWGEISSPAVATVAGYVFEILEEGIELLIRPPKPRS